MFARWVRWHRAGEVAPVSRAVCHPQGGNALDLRFYPKKDVTIRFLLRERSLG